MDDAILYVRFEADGDGFRALSPGIGRWSDPPRANSLVGPGSRLGFLTSLNTRRELVVPQGISGRIRGAIPHDRAVPVEFAQVLFELVPIAEDAEGLDPVNVTRPRGAPGADLPPGTWAIVSPTDGTFYRSPTPGAAPFVDVGSTLETGRSLGLVEVMKTFNRVLYGGPGLPDQAQIVEVRCADAAEVHAGQILFVVR